MAFYKYGKFLHEDKGAEFDTIHKPGAVTPFSGVYRCEGCGHSVTSVLQHPLPPQNHHQHIATQGAILWRLVVKSHWR